MAIPKWLRWFWPTLLSMKEAEVLLQKHEGQTYAKLYDRREQGEQPDWDSLKGKHIRFWVDSPGPKALAWCTAGVLVGRCNDWGKGSLIITSGSPKAKTATLLDVEAIEGAYLCGFEAIYHI